MRAMRRVLIVVLTMLLATATGCTGDDPESAAPPATGTGGDAHPVAIYLLRGDKVAPVRREIDQPSPYSALLALAYRKPGESERTAGYRTAVPPPDTSTGGVNVADGVARLDWWSRALPKLAQAQVVYTLTRFPGIRRVAFVVDGGESRALTRADFEAETPVILVESPLPGDTVASPIRLRGTANVFEATVSVDVRDAQDRLLKRTFTTATSGSGTRGTFSTALAVPDRAGEVTVVAYESSAKDGSPLHVVEVPVEVER